MMITDHTRILYQPNTCPIEIKRHKGCDRTVPTFAFLFNSTRTELRFNWAMNQSASWLRYLGNFTLLYCDGGNPAPPAMDRTIVNNGKNCPYQLVIAGFLSHQQYLFKQDCYNPLPGNHYWPTCSNTIMVFSRVLCLVGFSRDDFGITELESKHSSEWSFLFLQQIL